MNTLIYIILIALLISKLKYCYVYHIVCCINLADKPNTCNDQSDKYRPGLPYNQKKKRESVDFIN